MGLAAPKKRTLISADPRNNNWANNTETFGQKLLRAHGWTPGNVLGAKDSAHAEYLTEASSSHIKVTFREDNMGIGSKKNNGDTCTGLNDFQDLLGRLNGKTEVKIEAERQVRENMKRNAYVERKFGVMRFVQGGWLVGDQETKALEALAVAKDKEEDVSSDSDSSDSESEEEEPEQAAEPTKKRKADDAEDTKDSDKKKSKKRKSSDEPEGETEKQKRKRERQERRERKELKRSKRAEKEKRKKSKESGSDEAGETGTTTDTTSKKSKKDKRKKKDRESKDSGESDTEQKRSKKKRRKEATEATVVVQETTSITTTPAGSGTSTPTTRFTSRARFIAQKRAAFADPKALAQILMVKPPSLD